MAVPPMRRRLARQRRALRDRPAGVDRARVPAPRPMRPTVRAASRVAFAFAACGVVAIESGAPQAEVADVEIITPED